MYLLKPNYNYNTGDVLLKGATEKLIAQEYSNWFDQRAGRLKFRYADRDSFCNVEPEIVRLILAHPELENLDEVVEIPDGAHWTRCSDPDGNVMLWWSMAPLTCIADSTETY